MSKIKTALAIGAVSTITLCGSVLPVAPVFAAEGVREYVKTDNATDYGFANNNNFQTIIMNIINIALGLVGILSVAMIVYGGFQYTTSAGDSGKVTKAKNTILYGVIGLIISMLAFAIVNFVIGQITGTAQKP